MSGTPLHGTHSYQEELAQLRGLLSEMGRRAGRQIAEAADALVHRDAARAAEVIRQDAELDHLERQVDAFCVRFLALRQPLASDLRLIVAALKVSHDLERIGDYAANVAQRAILLGALPQVGDPGEIARMATLVRANLSGAVDALVRGDAARATEVWGADAPVDEIYNRIFRAMLTHMMENPPGVSAAAHHLFVARNLERIGDHATNIAEMAHYAACGETLPENRPKADTSARTVVPPPERPHGG